MQMLFVDESGTPPPVSQVKDGDFFILGGAIIPDEFWHRVKADLDGLKKNIRLPGK